MLGVVVPVCMQPNRNSVDASAEQPNLPQLKFRLLKFYDSSPTFGVLLSLFWRGGLLIFLQLQRSSLQQEDLSGEMWKPSYLKWSS